MIKIKITIAKQGNDKNLDIKKFEKAPNVINAGKRSGNNYNYR